MQMSDSKGGDPGTGDRDTPADMEGVLYVFGWFGGNMVPTNVETKPTAMLMLDIVQ